MLAAVQANLVPPLVRLVPTVARPAAQLPSFYHQKAALCLLAPFGLVRFITEPVHSFYDTALFL